MNLYIDMKTFKSDKLIKWVLGLLSSFRRSRSVSFCSIHHSGTKVIRHSGLSEFRDFLVISIQIPTFLSLVLFDHLYYLIITWFVNVDILTLICAFKTYILFSLGVFNKVVTSSSFAKIIYDILTTDTLLP